jgi:hypothetical protein
VADAVTHGFPGRAVAVDVAMFELDAGAVGRLGDEPDLDLARVVRCRLDRCFHCDVPAYSLTK